MSHQYDKVTEATPESRAQTRRRRIAVVCPGLDSGMGGGVPRVARFLVRSINESKAFSADLISLATSRNDRLSVRIRKPSTWLSGVRVAQMEKDGWAFRHVGARWVEVEFQRYQPRPALTVLLSAYDIVQVVSGTPAWAVTCKGIPLPVFLQVATLTGLERKSLLQRGSWVERAYRAAMTALVGRLDAEGTRIARKVFVENENMASHLAKWTRPESIVFAPPGVDTEQFVPSAYQRGGYLLSIGRFADPRKNVRMLFEAYAHVRSRTADIPRLVLAGRTGPTVADMEVLDKLGIRSMVDIHTGVDDDELAALYRGASMFVLSSDEEGLGLVILEAMASGLPVVSTDCGGPRTMIADGVTGRLTPVGDPTALARAIVDLWEDPERREAMGREGRRVVEERFSLDVAARPFLEAYGEVAQTVQAG